MTDKDKIINEIKLRLQNNESILNEGIDNIPNLNGRIEEEKSLLAFINSLPEKPVSKDLEEEINRYIDPLTPADIQENPFTSIEKCAHYFANWQKEQMEKDAVNAIVCKNISNELRVNSVAIPDNHPSGIKFGDDVKIIIIKEARNERR